MIQEQVFTSKQVYIVYTACGNTGTSDQQAHIIIVVTVSYKEDVSGCCTYVMVLMLVKYVILWHS